MYKYILLLILSIVTTSCTGMAKIKDRYHRAPFEKEIEKGNYKITLYQIKYPKNYEDKIKFYNDYGILMKKLLVYDATLNILYSEELKDDILELENNLLLPEEEVYVKSSSDLSEVEKDIIDEKVDINMDKEVGNSQYYLNKQIYFLKKTLGEDQNTNRNYTELEKERVVQRVKSMRKEIFEITGEVELTSILRIDNPYETNKESYWETKEVYIDSNTELSPRVLKGSKYKYLNDVRDKDIKKIMGRELKFDSKIVIIENNLYDGYTVIDNKYVFFVGGKYKKNYYDGYTIKFEIKNVTLKDLLTVDDDLLISDFLNPHLYRERQVK